MSNHEGVSCDLCLKRNFRGKRYKCLKCPDYDLCSACHDQGTSSGRHTNQHPMQCILTRNDLELFFAGENVANDQPYSFTCPLCGLLGFTDTTLYEHVNVAHVDNSNSFSEVVCPICATLPDGEANQLFNDFLNHLNVEHRSGSNTANREMEEPQIVRIRQRHVRMSSRNRRSQFLNSTSTATTSNNRETIDPIAQLLSQLSDVRRVNSSSSSGQNLWQFPFERQSNTDRSSLERIIQRQRRQIAPNQHFLSVHPSSTHADSNANQSTPYVLLDSAPSPSVNNSNANSVVGHSTKCNSNFLLNSCASMLSQENDLKKIDTLKVDRSIFVQELIFACLSDSIINNADNLMIGKTSEEEVKVQTELNDPAAAKSSNQNIKNNNNDTKELKDKNCNNDSNHQMIADEVDSASIQERIKMPKDCENNDTSSNNNKNNKVVNNLSLETETADKNLESKVQMGQPANNTSNNSATTYGLSPSEPENRQRSSMQSLVTSGGGGGGTSPSFIVSQTAVNHNNTSRNNKVNKVRSSSAMAPSLTLRSSLTTPVVGGAINVVPPSGRRKILKQTEPPPHYE